MGALASHLVPFLVRNSPCPCWKIIMMEHFGAPPDVRPCPQGTGVLGDIWVIPPGRFSHIRLSLWRFLHEFALLMEGAIYRGWRAILRKYWQFLIKFILEAFLVKMDSRVSSSTVIHRCRFWSKADFGATPSFGILGALPQHRKTPGMWDRLNFHRVGVKANRVRVQYFSTLHS